RLGLVIKDHLWEFIKEVEPDLITFPPLNTRRFWVRGFNHVEEMLKGAHVPCIQVYKRVGFSPPMARLSAQERQKAVGEYTLREETIDLLEGKRILLVDDILTTGSTLSRLAYLALYVGAQEVYAYVIAKD
ncbi:MAG: ComF family protein, partial [Aquificota bacterium]